MFFPRKIVSEILDSYSSLTTQEDLKTFLASKSWKLPDSYTVELFTVIHPPQPSLPFRTHRTIVQDSNSEVDVEPESESQPEPTHQTPSKRPALATLTNEPPKKRQVMITSNKTNTSTTKQS